MILNHLRKLTLAPNTWQKIYYKNIYIQKPKKIRQKKHRWLGCGPPHGVVIATNKAQRVTAHRNVKHSWKESLSSRVIGPVSADTKLNSNTHQVMDFFFLKSELSSEYVEKSEAGFLKHSHPWGPRSSVSAEAPGNRDEDSTAISLVISLFSSHRGTRFKIKRLLEWRQTADLQDQWWYVWAGGAWPGITRHVCVDPHNQTDNRHVQCK